jgi:hypothetical protein
MLTLDEAVDHLAAVVVRNHAVELLHVYRAHPTLTTRQPRKTLCSAVSHAISVKIIKEIRPAVEKRIYPVAIENMPAMTRVERKVFKSILDLSQQRS